jgi:hypothetical protein
MNGAEKMKNRFSPFAFFAEETGEFLRYSFYYYAF